MEHLLIQVFLITFLPHHQAMRLGDSQDQGMLIPHAEGCPLITPLSGCQGKIVFGERSTSGEYNTVGSIIHVWNSYFLTGDYMYCQLNGKYNATSDCAKVSTVGCDAPSKPLQMHLRVSPKDQRISVGQVLYFYCDDNGYNLAGTHTLTCINSSLWSDKIPTCKMKNEGCEYPGSFDNGYYLDSNKNIYYSGIKPVNEVIEANCDDKFSLHNQHVLRTCQSDGFWTGRKPNCVSVTCNPPTPPQNAFYTFTNGSRYTHGKTFLGTNIYLKCVETFYSIGIIYSVCQSDGTWSNLNHSCKNVTCKGPTYVTNGDYYTSSNIKYTESSVFQINDTIFVKCDTSFTLKTRAQRQCILSGNSGKWSGEDPVCSPVAHTGIRPSSPYRADNTRRKNLLKLHKCWLNTTRVSRIKTSQKLCTWVLFSTDRICYNCILFFQDHKGVLEEEDFSVLVDLSSHKSSVDGIKDITNTVGRKNVKHGRVLGDISNTVCLKPSPTKKSRRSKTAEGSTKTEPVETRSIETQTEETSFVQPPVVFRSDHTYSRVQKMSTPAKTTAEPMELDISAVNSLSFVSEDTVTLNVDTDQNSSSDSSSVSLTYKDNERTDPNYMQSSSSSDESITDLKDQDITDRTFLVFGSSLEQIFSLVLCIYCGASSMVTQVAAWGTRLIVEFQCIKNHDFTWKSQPDAGK
ncbi:uncharacterized protein LOC128555963 [Mercenaria mercenaria]|uniref:uncharacterized protein LOC128555963 n=1 Tax=Mercenaria mercenaria TaxID=6596 RepID=UPI00234F7E44|nr:uncharacterized protein LOC128555963 [Mercenaria mercenaria]